MNNILLDAKARTFLAVYTHRSFTRAAAALFVTQPAVTQQVQALQEEMGHTLYTIAGRQVVLTETGERLGQFLRSLSQDIVRFAEELDREDGVTTLRCGATRTIGEFTLPPILATMLKKPDRRLSLVIDNTEVLLHKIDNAEIDFAWIEGAFDKRRYDYRLFSHEPFIGIAEPALLARTPSPTLQSLLGERLLVRERGSGTRAVLEGLLADRGLGLGDFSSVGVIDNLNVIKALVGDGQGISFMYEAAAQDAIASGRVVNLPIEGWQVMREFNFVFAQGTRWTPQLLAIHEEALSIARNQEEI